MTTGNHKGALRGPVLPAEPKRQPKEPREKGIPMTKAKISVTGAGRKTGFAIASRLREEEWPVRAPLRTDDDRRAALERLGADVVVREATHGA
jgi:hypothetical protein